MTIPLHTLMRTLLFISTAFILNSCEQTPALSEEAIPNFERLANAIYKAEGEAKTRHPYGILTKYKHTTPRQACINTVKNQWKRHLAHNCHKDYLTCLRDRYAPINSDTDNGTNQFWLKNVSNLYSKALTTSVN